MPRLRLVTFNIAHARGLTPIQGITSQRKLRHNLRRIAALLERLAPDIVAVQEIDERSRWAGNFDHLDYLRVHTRFPHTVFGINNRRAGLLNLSYGNAILSRHAIRTAETVTFGQRRVGEKGFLFVELDVAGRVVPLVNLHLHFSSRAQRLKQLERLLAWLRDKHRLHAAGWAVPPIVCGDFNNSGTRDDATASLLSHRAAPGQRRDVPLAAAAAGAGLHLFAVRLCRGALRGRALAPLGPPAGGGGIRAEIGKNSLRRPRLFAAMRVPMSRLAAAFARTRAQNRAAFVAYLCAGDPDFDTSLEVCRAVLANGADVLELGVPFSDPLADGLTNQLAAQRALESGMTAARVFELARRLRESSDVPIIFYTYYNLMFANGVEAYVRAAKAAGVDGILTLDLPPEEAGEIAAACRTHGVDTVFIVAPTTPDARIAKIAAATTGFIYYVSREGVTGVRDQVAANIPEAVARIRAHTPLPVAVGFGIGTRAQVAQVAAHADGVIVGSVLVNAIRDHLADRAQLAPAVAARVRDLAAGTARG